MVAVATILTMPVIVAVCCVVKLPEEGGRPAASFDN